jgi:hypothetical protein
MICDPERPGPSNPGMRDRQGKAAEGAAAYALLETTFSNGSRGDGKRGIERRSLLSIL